MEPIAQVKSLLVSSEGRPGPQVGQRREWGKTRRAKTQVQGHDWPNGLKLVYFYSTTRSRRYSLLVVHAHGPVRHTHQLNRGRDLGSWPRPADQTYARLPFDRKKVIASRFSVELGPESHTRKNLEESTSAQRHCHATDTATTVSLSIALYCFAPGYHFRGRRDRSFDS